MRFSLKWGLFGMAYVAVAAAALSQEHWAYADLLWLATFLAVCVSILTAIFGSGSRRATAIGFALFACGFAVCAQFASQSIPTRRILLAAGVPEYTLYQPAPAIYSSPQPALSATYSTQTINSYPLPGQSAPATAYAPIPAPPIVAFAASPVELPFISKVRATNSISSMLLGLVGAWLAAAAYRRHRAGSEASAA
jgi:hypothetical protein